MPTKYSQLKKRIMTASVAIPMVIAAIYWSAWSYFFLFLFVAMATMQEFYKLVEVGGACPSSAWGILSGVLTYTLVFMYASSHIPAHYLYVLWPVIALTYPIELYKKGKAPFTNIAYTLLGIAYASVPFALFHLIAFVQGTYRYEIVLGILLIVWANDTGAYIVGSRLGKHRLFQRISPKKSWEGVLGGAAFALIVSYGIGHYFSSLHGELWLGIGSTIVVVGTYGDLVASMFKRSLALKDSGQTLPGHGGFLDRFDSLLLAIPFILALIKLWGC
ncbi:MAG: phosphatidate cytidylyltransferase [Bacteroidota bacterium]